MSEKKLRDRLKARMKGAIAALEGKTMADNPYSENDDLHFIWLEEWVGAKIEMRKPKPQGTL